MKYKVSSTSIKPSVEAGVKYTLSHLHSLAHSINPAFPFLWESDGRGLSYKRSWQNYGFLPSNRDKLYNFAAYDIKIYLL